MLLFDSIFVTSSGNARFPLDAPTVTKILWEGCCSSAAAAEESRKCAHVTMSHVNMRVRRGKSSFQLLALFPYGIFVTSATSALFQAVGPLATQYFCNIRNRGGEVLTEVEHCSGAAPPPPHVLNPNPFWSWLALHLHPLSLRLFFSKRKGTSHATQCTSHTAQCTAYIARCTLHVAHCSLFRTPHTAHCTLTLHSAQRT